jgi:hypothetical protein
MHVVTSETVLADLIRRSWNMRESARQAASFTLQSHKLEKLQASIEAGNTALIERVTASATQIMASRTASLQQPSLEINTVFSRPLAIRGRHGKMRSYRLSLPRWLVGCVWEFSMHESHNVWTFQLSPVNIRPAHTYVFDFVRAGDVEAVRDLLRSRKLSVRDCEQTKRGASTLLEVSLLHF